MPYGRNIHAQIERIGQVASVYVRKDDGTDQLGNREFRWEYDRDVVCVRSYPNRNTEQEGNSGTLEEDRPVFIFPSTVDNPDQPEPPSGQARLDYNGVRYSLSSPTEYGTHIEIMGNRIDN